MLGNAKFRALASSPEFGAMLSNAEFGALAGNPEFGAMLSSAEFVPWLGIQSLEQC